MAHKDSLLYLNASLPVSMNCLLSKEAQNGGGKGGREGGRVAYGKTGRKGQKWRHNVVECVCVQAIFKTKKTSPCPCRLHSATLSLSLLHPSIYTYFAYIMDVIIIPACRHVAPAFLLPLSKKAGTTGTQPDYPINLL